MVARRCAKTWQVLEQVIDPYDMGIVVVDVNFLPSSP